MAKKEPNIADLISMMEKNQVSDQASTARSADAAATDAVMLKGSLDDLNKGFGSVFSGKVDSLISERTPHLHSDLLDQIRRGVDGMKLSIGARIGRFFTNFAGLFPNRAARKAAHAASLATALQQADTADIADTGRGIINELRSQSGLSKISEDKSERRAKAIWGAKGFFSKNMSRVGSAMGWLTGKGGAGKEEENEERRHKSKHISLLEQILEALGAKVKDDDDGGGGGFGKMGRWALMAKRLGTIAAIIGAIAIAPFVFFGAFAKQLWTETKVIGVWVAKATKWGKGTFFDPIKNAFNRIFKVGEWADDFKKGFNRQWSRFKARFNPSSLMQIFSRFKTRLTSIRLNMIDKLAGAMKGFRESKAVTNLMARITAFGNTLKNIKTNMIKTMRDTMKAFRNSKAVTNIMARISAFGTTLKNIKTDMIVKARNTMKAFRNSKAVVNIMARISAFGTTLSNIKTDMITKARNVMKAFRNSRAVTNIMARISAFGTTLSNIKTDMIVKARNTMKAFRNSKVVVNIMQRISSFGTALSNIKTNMITSLKTAVDAFKKTKAVTNLTATIGAYGTRLTNIKTSFNASLGRAVRAFGKTKAVTNVGATFGFLASQYNKVAARLNTTVTKASTPRAGPRGGPRTVNPFTALRSKFSLAQGEMTARITKWTTAFQKSPMMLKMAGMFNVLKAPFISIQEFLGGKKVARPPGMPSMAAATKTGGIMKIVTGMKTFFSGMKTALMAIPGVSLIIKGAAALGRVFGKYFWPITILFGIFDGIMQWKTNDGFTEDTKPDTWIKKIGASVSRAIGNLLGMFIDMPAMAIGWILSKMGFGKVEKSVGPKGHKVTVDAPWMKNLKTMDFSGTLFRVFYSFFNMVSNIVDFIGDLITKPVETIKGIFNSQWVKDHIWDSGGGETGPGGMGAANPMRLFGIPLVFPSLPSINWPNWGQLFKDYIYDGSVDGQIKILGMTLSWPTLSEDFSLLDLLPVWLRNPKEFFSGWFKGVKSFFGFGDDEGTAPKTRNQIIAEEALAGMQSKLAKMKTEASSFIGTAAGKAGHTSGKTVEQYWKDKIGSQEAGITSLEANIDKMTLNSRPRLGVALIDAQGNEILTNDFLRNVALMGSLGPAAAMGGGGGGSQSIVVDGKQTHVSNIAINANQGMSDPTTYAGSTSVA